MRTGGRVTLCAIPKSYGPAGKVVAIAHYLSKRGVRPAFVGQGTALELVVRSQDLFQDILEGGPQEGKTAAVFASSEVVVSVMDAQYAGAAVRSGASVHIVDSLSSMWDSVPASYGEGKRHWVQNLGTGQEHLSLASNRRLVGPIVVNRPARNPDSVASKLVVHLGGCEPRFSSLRRDDPYPRFIVEGIIESGLTQNFETTILLAGSSGAQNLRRQFPRSTIQFCSMSQEAAIGEFETAEMVLSTPGLTAALECFQSKTPVFFLPPHFYTQWWNLVAFRERGVAAGALHWKDLSPTFPVRPRAARAEADASVYPAIDEFCRSDAAAHALRNSLYAYLEADRPAVADKQNQFFTSLGPNGAQVIAEEIAKELAARAG